MASNKFKEFDWISLDEEKGWRPHSSGQTNATVLELTGNALLVRKRKFLSACDCPSRTILLVPHFCDPVRLGFSSPNAYKVHVVAHRAGLSRSGDLDPLQLHISDHLPGGQTFRYQQLGPRIGFHAHLWWRLRYGEQTLHFSGSIPDEDSSRFEDHGTYTVVICA